MNTIFEHGEFTDYAGQTHKFTVAGIIITPDTNIDLYKEEFDEDYIDWHRDVDEEDLICWGEPVGDVAKVISIGISICNPLDTYNEKRGFLQSEGRAKKYAFLDGDPNQRIIAVNKSGMANEETVKFFVHQTAEALSKNPGLFIKGYNGAAKKHIK